MFDSVLAYLSRTRVVYCLVRRYRYTSRTPQMELVVMGHPADPSPQGHPFTLLCRVIFASSLRRPRSIHWPSEAEPRAKDAIRGAAEDP